MLHYETADRELSEAHGVLDAIRRSVASVVVGKDDVLEQLLVALLCDGHALLEDVPGMGKTLLARSLAGATTCQFRRVQFTPDVLPSDVTGSTVYNQQTSEFEFRPGPVFTHVLLADEINRATPRSQSALLEAMQERQVTVDGQAVPLPGPFVVLATQNPIELEGTFPLPEAQLDRFLIRVKMGYPTYEEETAIVKRFEKESPLEHIVPAATAEQIVELQGHRSQVRVSDPVRDYVLGIVRQTRVDGRLALGVSPRGTLALHHAAQARALLRGQTFVLPDDVKALAEPVLAHRLLLTADASLRGETVNAILADIVSKAPVPVEDEWQSSRCS